MTKYKEIEAGQAIFSDDRVYRYVLHRVWDETKPAMMMIGLNPSTADENRLDPTLRRVVGFAVREGCGQLYMTNLFAFRATDPKVMKADSHPVGTDNDYWLHECAKKSAIVVCGWGTHGGHMSRATTVLALLGEWNIPTTALKITAAGHPGHPLYLPADAPLVPFP